MRPKETIAATVNPYPRASRAAGWALLGGVVALVGGFAADWFARQDLDIHWETRPNAFALSMLLFGLAYSVVVGAALWRAGHAGWRRAAGFALIAMFWFGFGVNVGLMLAWNGPSIPGLPQEFLVWFAGLLTMTLWTVLSGLLFVPALRSRGAVVWLLAPGAGVAALAGNIAVVDFWWLLDRIIFVTAAWGAVQAAALSLALPRRL